jgi:hypothetical protein
VSSLGAIVKPSGAIRLIHDFSRPEGGLNYLTTDTSVRYPTIDNAVTLIKEGSFLAKVDLKSAYRSVPIHPDSFNYTGLQWNFSGSASTTYLYDCRLPFGASRSCRVFQAITSAIVRIMARMNFVCLAYIDDFLVIGENYEACKLALTCLVDLIPRLGLEVNWDKVEGPSPSLSFLGVQIDCVTRTLSLPPKKLSKFKELIASWSLKTKVSKKDLQHLVGKLNWCARVVFGGRSFMRNLINLIAKLKKSHHRIRLSKPAKDDISWWVTGLEYFHGTTGFLCDSPLPSYEFATDSCLVGGGGHFGNQWFYVNWAIDMPEVSSSHINVLELETVLLAAELWGPLWRNRCILVRSDNMATVSAVNKGSSRSVEMLGIIQRIFWLSVKFGFRLKAAFIPGKCNILSDLISRLHSSASAQVLESFLSIDSDPIECVGHMTEQSFLFLQESWEMMT